MLLIVISTKLPVALAMAKAARGYDNRNPRVQQASLTGWGARAVAAHQNSFEALMFFTPAVFISHLAGTPEMASQAATLAIVHTVARILYPAAYIANVHAVRSIIWGAGFVSSVWLAFLPVI